ncbi:glutamate receptor 2.7-like isoform X1 [Typha angustifolia]|uniref:glutamate receptor 2.7-like isoform X1 n=2 Tax=Typha angustifolia TaxID=59011 RepID=UPI003C2D542F
MEMKMEKPIPVTLVFFASYFFLLFFSSVSYRATVGLAQNTAVPVHVGVILDLASAPGKRSQTSIRMAIEDFYAAHGDYSTRVTLDMRDSKNDVIVAASAAVDLLENAQVQAIIGPQTSYEAEFVAHLCNRTQVPMLSFSATSPALSPARTPYFVRATLNDSAQAAPVAALIQSFGWRNVVLIYEDSDYGAGIVPSFVDALQSIDVRVPYRAVIPTSATEDRIDEELYRLKTMQTRVFVVHMLPALGSRLFLRAKDAGMMTEDYAWITTDSIIDAVDTLKADVIDAMQGVVGFRPYMATTKKNVNFTSRFKARFRQDFPTVEDKGPTEFQFWAYDAAWAVAMAAEIAQVSGPSFNVPENGILSTDLGRLGVSQNGPRLLDAIQNLEFDGLARKFRLVKGQLLVSAFEIVNVIGKGTRNIGFWNPNLGISRHLNSTRSGGKNGLKQILWPGDSMVVPKGWDIPTDGKKLQIGVPVKHGFNEFVNVVTDPVTNISTVTGYCIDVFDAVMQKLPYAVLYEYVPVYDSSISYDTLVYQVYLKKFDAVVGDTTIVANRTNYVDFTLPYTESGVSMIVAVQEDARKNAWIFLQPLTPNLWLGSLSFFFFTGFVVWVIEHRVNPEFRGTPWQQFGIIFYFAFSTLVFAHKEKLESNLSRFVVIIWVFVVLILTSSYTASLTSMLTVQQLQPTVTDVNELQRLGESVGYQDGSFVLGLLKRLKFDERKLRNYSTADEYADALSKGTANGGVAAIFDEIPYLKLFLSNHCADYTMIGPTYKTDGFGFVFPRNSPLVPDISRAILNVTEGDEMTRIERKWFGDPTGCVVESDSLSSSSLSFWSFGGLFLITGVVSILMLIIYLIFFFCKEQNELRAATSERTFWQKIVAISKHYDQKDLTSRTFQRDQDVASDGESNRDAKHRDTASLPEFDGSQSPISISNHSEIVFGSPLGGTPTTEPSSPWNRSPLPDEISIQLADYRERPELM